MMRQQRVIVTTRFAYWPGDAVKSYDPPPASAGGPLWPTGYGYDLDGALTSVTLPDGTRGPQGPFGR